MKKVIVASDMIIDKDLTQVDNESDFKVTINQVIRDYKPKKLIETGTYLGEGTTRIIIESLNDAGINNYQFYSIEINLYHLIQAKENLKKRGYDNKVNLLHGLSIPKSLLPSIEKIRNYTVDNIEFENIIIDHREKERAIKYFQETNFDNVLDDLIEKVLEKFEYSPEFILLDSAGHLGNIEFNYIISKIKSQCIIALDDANHLKHYKSYLQIKNDDRFRIIKKSDEKFGFVVAVFSPEYSDTVHQLKLGIDELSSMQNVNHMLQHGEFDFNNKKLLLIRTDSIGDTILSIGMIKAIKEQFPNCNITVLIQEHIFPIYDLCPYVNSIIVVNKEKFYNHESYRNSFINDFHKNHFDLSINTIYSRDLFSDVFATAANIEFKIGFEGDLCNNDLTTKSKYDKRYNFLIKSSNDKVVEFVHYKAMMDAIGISNYDGLPWLWFDDKTMNFAENFYHTYDLNRDNVIILFAGGQHAIRDYKNFSQALNYVDHIEKFTVIAIGSNREYELHQEIFKTANYKHINLCGKLSLLESASLVYHSKLSIGTETSLSHISCAIEKPNITIIGGGHFGRFLPYSKLSSIVYLPLDCYYCNWQCKQESPYCITEIDPNIITEAINDVINDSIGKVYQQLYLENDKEKIDRKIKPKNYLDLTFDNIVKFDKAPRNFNKGDQIINNSKEFKVSALVSIYKSERFMKGLMEDLTNQTLFSKGELEILLINSNSPENEYDLIRPYLEKYPNQIIYLKTIERETLYKAWNSAIEISHGKYLTNANTDDRHRVDALEILARALDEYPEFDLIYPDLLITEIENETFESTMTTKRYEYPDYNLGTYLSNSIFGAQPMWRKSVHSQIGYFDEDLKISGDYEFFLRLSKEFKPVHLRETLGLFLQGRDSITNQNNVNDIIKESYISLNRHRRNIDLRKVYPNFVPERNDLGEILSVIWDFGVLNMLSPYQDIDNAIACFNKCLELAKLTNQENVMQDMYNNNLGIININLGNNEKGLDYWSKSKDNNLIQTNLQIYKHLDSKASPIKFQTSLLRHPVLDNARSTFGLYLDENKNIKKSEPLIQYFWDVYYGNDGVEISEMELQNAQDLKPRSPKSQGYLKSYHQIWDEKYIKRPKENLTSLSRFFWERDYINKKNVLIKTPSAIGDSFAITTIVNNLKYYYPHLKITIACTKNEKDVYLYNSQVENVIQNNCYDSDIFELETDSLEVIDYNHLISLLPEYYNGLSYLDIFGNIAGIKLIDRSYKYYIQESEIEKVQTYIHDEDKIYAIHLHTSKDKKRTYPYHNELVVELLKEFPECKIINLGQVELEINDNRIIDAAKLKLNLREQIALSSFATDFITIDSAFYNIGHNLLKKNTYTIFGPTNPNLTGNPENTFYVIQNNNLDCLYCYWSKENQIKCMNELKPKSILQQITTKQIKGLYYNGEHKVNYLGNNYEEFLFNFFQNNKLAKKIIINDFNKLLPYYATNWNGIEVIGD